MDKLPSMRVPPSAGKVLRAFGEEVTVYLGGAETGGKFTLFTDGARVNSPNPALQTWIASSKSARSMESTSSPSENPCRPTITRGMRMGPAEGDRKTHQDNFRA